MICVTCDQSAAYEVAQKHPCTLRHQAERHNVPRGTLLHFATERRTL